MYNSKNRFKGKLTVHIILVTKYRKAILKKTLLSLIYKVINDIAMDMNCILQSINGSSDHIHILICYPPSVSVDSLVKRIKQNTTYKCWQKHYVYLSKYYYKQHLLWTDGYFASSTGMISDDIVKQYIENQ